MFPFFFVIVLSVFFCGLYPGLLALVLSLVGINKLVLAADWLSHPEWALALNVAFCVFSLIIIVFAHAQQQLVNALKESRQDLELAQAVAQIGSWRFNRKSKKETVQWSAETYRIFGIAEGAPVNYQSFIALVHPEDRDYVKNAGIESSKGKPYDLEYRILVNGEIKWLNEKIIYDLDSKGRIVSGFGISQDITARKQAEQNIKTSNERYELVLDGSQDGIWDWDIVTNLVNYSSQWKLLRGYNLDEVLTDPRPWRDNIHPDDEVRVMGAMEEHIAGKTPIFAEEYRIRCQDGSWKWILDRGLVKKDETGRPIRMAGSETDITDRKTAAIALFESEKQLKLLLNLMPDLICYLDTELTYLNTSKNFGVWWGGVPQDVIGQTVQQVADEETWRDIQPRLKQALCGESVNFDISVWRNDKLHWINISYIPDIDNEGKVEGLMVQLANISDRKLVEQKLQQQEYELQLIMNLAPSLIAYINSDFRYVRVNEYYLEWFGKAIDQIIGHEVREIIGEATWNIVKPYMEQAFEGKTVNFELETKNPKPEFRWVQVAYIPNTDHTGKIKGIVANVTNITKVKNAVLAVKEREDQLQLIMDLMPALISYVDTDFRYIRVNKVYEEWFDVAVQDVIGRTVRENIGEIVWKMAAPGLERARNGELVSYEQFVTYENEVSRWTAKSYIPVKDETGAVKGIIIHISDISERKATEQALVEKENALRFIMDAMPALVAYVDTDYRYIRVNKTYESWLGIPTERIVGSEIKDIIGEKAWQLVKPNMSRAMAGENVHYDFLIPYETAEPKWIHANYIPDVDQSGQVKGIVALIVDIGEIKQADLKIALLNQALEHRVEELEAIFEAAPVGLAITNRLDGKAIRGNTTLEKILGLPLHSEISLKAKQPPAYQVFKGANKLATNELPMQRALMGEMIVNQFIDVKRADGKLINLLTNTVPLFDEKSKIRGAVGIFMDVTQFRQAELALKESEERLLLAKQAGDLGVFDFDLITGEVRWDQRMQEIYGIDPDDIITTATCKERAHPDDQHIVENAWKMAFDQNVKRNYPVEYRVIRPKDKRIFHVAAFAFTRFQDDKPVRLVGFVQDITERRKTEETLRNTQIRLTLAMEPLKGGYWDWELESDSVYFSPEWKQQLGFENHEIPNHFQEWVNRLHPEDKDSTLETIDKYLHSNQELYEAEFRLRHKDGSYRWILSRAGLTYNRNNQLSRMAGIHIDITEVKNRQEMNQRRHDMEDSLRLNLVIQTVAAIAHELNQPLTAISFLADGLLAMVRSGNQNSEKMLKALTTCSEQSQRAGQVIRQLMSVLERGDTPIEMIDINQAIYSALELAKSFPLYGKCRLELNLADDLPKVTANELRLQKVLDILISNALEAMHENASTDASLTITTRLFPNDSAFMQLTVSDSGIGLSDINMLKDIFKPFYTTKGEGLGMGLAIARSLIEAHGGRMWAEQNVHSGLSIHFTLPFA